MCTYVYYYLCTISTAIYTCCLHFSQHQHSRVVEISTADDPSAPISHYPVIPSNLPPLNTLLKVCFIIEDVQQ